MRVIVTMTERKKKLEMETEAIDGLFLQQGSD